MRSFLQLSVILLRVRRGLPLSSGKAAPFWLVCGLTAPTDFFVSSKLSASRRNPGVAPSPGGLHYSERRSHFFATFSPLLWKKTT
jgi:hypothetical protein